MMAVAAFQPARSVSSSLSPVPYDLSDAGSMYVDCNASDDDHDDDEEEKEDKNADKDLRVPSDPPPSSMLNEDAITVNHRGSSTKRDRADSESDQTVAKRVRHEDSVSRSPSAQRSLIVRLKMSPACLSVQVHSNVASQALHEAAQATNQALVPVNACQTLVPPALDDHTGASATKHVDEATACATKGSLRHTSGTEKESHTSVVQPDESLQPGTAQVSADSTVSEQHEEESVDQNPTAVPYGVRNGSSKTPSQSPSTQPSTSNALEEKMSTKGAMPDRSNPPTPTIHRSYGMAVDTQANPREESMHAQATADVPQQHHQAAISSHTSALPMLENTDNADRLTPLAPVHTSGSVHTSRRSVSSSQISKTAEAPSKQSGLAGDMLGAGSSSTTPAPATTTANNHPTTGESHGSTPVPAATLPGLPCTPTSVTADAKAAVAPSERSMSTTPGRKPDCDPATPSTSAAEDFKFRKATIDFDNSHLVLVNWVHREGKCATVSRLMRYERKRWDKVISDKPASFVGQLVGFPKRSTVTMSAAEVYEQYEGSVASGDLDDCVQFLFDEVCGEDRDVQRPWMKWTMTMTG